MKRIPAAMSSWNTGQQLRWLRQYLNETQTEFWARFGVTQSQGSRFEQGTGMPPPVAILMALYLELKVSDADLVEARQQGLTSSR